MKIENTEVYGFRRALYGLRNPMNSWKKADSEFAVTSVNRQPYEAITCLENPDIGPADMKLACKLIKGGTEHRKFLRQIMVWVDFTLPRYVWTELDTYKVATVRNSCSTMHKLGSTNLTQDDFAIDIPEGVLGRLNDLGGQARSARLSKEIKIRNQIHKELKNLLPEGFLQKATYTMSYETALTMFRSRKNHRLIEWNIKNPESICSWILTLPYMKEWIEN